MAVNHSTAGALPLAPWVPRVRPGFTFVEVLVILMVVTVGMLGAVGLMAYGKLQASKAQGGSMAMATAISIAADPQPRLDPLVSADWSYTPYDLNNSLATQTSTARGYINGLYIVRTETSLVQDIIAQSAVNNFVYARSALVEVKVYETIGGSELVSFVTRIIRQRETP